MPDRYDVIVVGAGPAGSTLATLVARTGRRVALVDAANFPRQKVCGEYLGPGAVPVLEALGVASTISAMAAPVRSVSVMLSTGARLCTSVDSSDHAAPIAISRYQFDHLLVEAAARAGAEIILQSRVGEVLLNDTRASGVTARSRAAHALPLTLKAPAIVAADGRNSRIVAQTGRRWRRGPALVGFKRHVPPEDAGDLSPGTLEMHSLPGGYAGVCRVEDGQTNLCGVLPRHLVADARGGFTDAICSWASSHVGLSRLTASDPAVNPWWTMA